MLAENFTLVFYRKISENIRLSKFHATTDEFGNPELLRL